MKRGKLISITTILWTSCVPAMAQLPDTVGTIVTPMNVSTMSPLQYLKGRRQALVAAERHDWQQARPLLEQLVGSYPFDGETWHALGDARSAAGQPGAAGEAYATAARYGLSSNSDGNAADAARAFAKAGQYDRALGWLGYSLHDLTYREPEKLLAEAVFDPMRNLSGFHALSAKKAKLRDGSRAARLQADLDYFMQQYSLYRFPKLTPTEIARVKQAASQLRLRMVDLTDDQIVVEIQRLSALAPGGHNTAPSFGYGYGMDEHVLHSIPLDLYLFPEGLFVIGTADAKYQDLVGAEVIRFGSIPTQTMLNRAAPLIDRDRYADGQVIDHAPGFLSQLPVLRYLGATVHSDTVSLTVTKEGRERIVDLAGIPHRDTPTFHPSLISDHAPPLTFAQVGNHYWFTDIGPATTYVQFNQVVDQAGETLLQFGERLRRYLQDRGIMNLIVDVRFNGGGNTFKYLELLRTIIWFDAQPGHHLYYVEGRATFSAAVNFTTEVRKLTHAVFVGEPASSPRAAGDPAFVTLPNTGLQVKYSTNVWSVYYPDDDRTWIAPDLPVVLKAADYFANRDTVLETLEQLIGGAS